MVPSDFHKRMEFICVAALVAGFSAFCWGPYAWMVDAAVSNKPFSEVLSGSPLSLQWFFWPFLTAMPLALAFLTVRATNVWWCVVFPSIVYGACMTALLFLAIFLALAVRNLWMDMILLAVIGAPLIWFVRAFEQKGLMISRSPLESLALIALVVVPPGQVVFLASLDADLARAFH